MLHLHGLVNDLGGDLAGVVARHVRVDVPQHHTLRIAYMFLGLCGQASEWETFNIQLTFR